MFSKIDKKVLIILIVFLIVVLFAGFFVFKYLKEIKTTVQDSLGGTNTEESGQQDNNSELSPNEEEQSSIDTLSPQIEIESQPGLSICADKCGDGVCQASDPECKNSMNCVCPETKQDCPSDCK